jgi:hypothetical protein
MKLNQLSIEELVELRTQMVLEKKSTTQINRVIDEKEREYVKLLLEDTSATGGPAWSVSRRVRIAFSSASRRFAAGA